MDWRAKLQLKRGNASSTPTQNDVVYVFPYTIKLSSGTKTTYDSKEYTHGNYKVNVFVRSEPTDILITARYTANTIIEADGISDVLNFLKLVSRGDVNMYPGLPPPLLIFNYMGAMYKNVPVVIGQYSYDLENDVNYVINSRGDYVPTLLTLNITLKPQYTPASVAAGFDLESFNRGNLITRGYL